MKYKKLIIISSILIVVGLLTAIITLAVNQFNIGNLDKSIISKTYDINEDFESIECNLDSSNLNIYLTTDDKNYAICLEKENITFEVVVIDGVLIVVEKCELELVPSFRNSEVSLYLNKETLKNLKVLTSTSDICILDAFEIENIDINGSTNDVELMNLVSKQINITVSTGDVWIDRTIVDDLTVNATTGDIEVSNCKINENVKLKVSTGEVELSDNEITGNLEVEGKTSGLDFEHITCDNMNLKVTTGDITLEDVICMGDMNVNTDTGAVELVYSDAANIYITTNTGRVEGSILSDKMFDAQSRTGKVNVPEDKEGGVCKIRTSTGRINIVVE